MKNIAIAMIEKKFATVTIPNIPFSADGFEGSVTGISCVGLTIGTSAATIQPNAGVTLALGGISISCHAGWNYKLKMWPHWPSGSGTVDVGVAGSGGSLDLTLFGESPC